jgi:hypothetical protein
MNEHMGGDAMKSYIIGSLVVAAIAIGGRVAVFVVVGMQETARLQEEIDTHARDVAAMSRDRK